MLKKIILWLLGIIGIAIVVTLINFGPLLKDFFTMDIIEGGEGIFYIMDYGGNSGLIIGNDAAVLVDTKMGGGSKKLKKFVSDKIGDRKLYVVNTHHHSDHTGGNKLYPNTSKYAGNYGEELWLIENKIESLPTNWVTDEVVIDIGGKVVNLIPIGSNHTKADLFIYVPDHKVLFTGDVYCHLSHPVIKPDSEPNIDAWENQLRTYAKQEELTIETVIPGHGDIAEQKDLVLMADYFEDIKSLPKKVLKSKYKNWTKLPFLASLSKSLNYVANYYKKNNL